MNNNKKTTLKKGLDQIMGADVSKIISQIQDKNEDINLTKNEIEVDKLLANPYQPRRNFDKKELEGLTQSIKENGVFTPILVKDNGNGNYYIVAGERRTRASKLAGLKKIPAIIADISDESMQRIAIIENVQREDLNPIEIAESLRKMIDDQGLKQNDVAKLIGKSRSYVANALGLLKLDSKIINSVLEGKITYGHARPLITLDNATAKNIYSKILEQNLSVREVEGYSKAAKLREARLNKSTIKNNSKSNEIVYAEELVRNKLKTKVEIKNNSIVIKYRGKEQLSKILEKMNAVEK